MKIVLDMNIPEIWVSFLNGAGHEAVHWSGIEDIRADDVEIMTWAREHDYVGLPTIWILAPCFLLRMRRLRA